jgi:hypothetical protein
VARWVRKPGEVFAQWHLPGEAPVWAIDRGLFVAACGQSLGDSARLEQAHEDTRFGSHCLTCGGAVEATAAQEER